MTIPRAGRATSSTVASPCTRAESGSRTCCYPSFLPTRTTVNARWQSRRMAHVRDESQCAERYRADADRPSNKSRHDLAREELHRLQHARLIEIAEPEAAVEV